MLVRLTGSPALTALSPSLQPGLTKLPAQLTLTVPTGTTATVTLRSTTSIASCSPLYYRVTSVGGATVTEGTAVLVNGYWQLTRTLSLGIYEVLVYSNSSGDCAYASDLGILSIVTPGATATGGGWYQPDRTGGTNWSGNPRVNFGFTMQKTTKTIKGSTDQIVTYNGQVLWVNKGSWRLKAAISTTTRVNAAGSYSSGDKIPYGLIRPCPTSFSSTLPDPTAGICGSLSAITGSRAVFWLQPSVSVLSESG